MSNDRRRDGRADDAVVNAAWRKASSDEPSERVDATILGAARAEVRSKPTALAGSRPQPWWSRWQPLAAAAGVAGLAFVLVQMAPRHDRSPAPPAAERAAQPGSVVTPREEQGTATAGKDEAVKQESVAQEAVPQVAVAPAAPERAPSTPKPSPTRNAADAQEPAEAYVASDASAEAAAVVAPAARGAAESLGAPLSPDAWARRISALHASGDDVTAAAELRAFRRAYPDADKYLPDALGPWAASVPAQEQP